MLLVRAVTAAVIGMTGAAPAGPVAATTVTLTVEAGPLGITAPTTLDFDVEPGATARAMIPVIVSDLRAGELGWTAAVSVEAPPGGPALPASALSYTAGAALVAGTAAVHSKGTVTGFPAAVQSASDVSGSNTAQWDADLQLAMPKEAAAGTYTVAVVHSVY